MKTIDRKTEIINVAARLFKEKGYNAVTVRDIAKELEIKAASLYNHIDSKQEILVHIIINIAEEFTNVMNEVVNSDDTSINKIKKIISLHIDITLRNPDALACLNNDWMHLQNHQLSYFLAMRNQYEENFRTIIRNGIKNKEIRNINVEIVIFSILNTLRTLYIWYNKTKTLKPEIVKKDLTEMLLNGIV